jgi:hypothetical protein
LATPLSPDRLLAALRAEGLTVHEHAGWKTHRRDEATGKTFGPVIGVLIHHTGGHNDRELCFNGRADLPGPLCHSWLGKTAGLWMIGNGRTNHAGSVDLDVLNALRAETSPLPVDNQANADGNDVLYGLEIENLGNSRDPYPAGQYDEAVRWAAAICRAHGWSERSVAGHKEVQPGKIDPSFDMDVFRAAVAARLAHTPDWNPNEEDDMTLSKTDVGVLASTDGVFKAPTDAADYNPDPASPDHYWSFGSHVNDNTTRIRRIDKALATQTAQLAALAAAVGALAAGGGLDAAEIQAAAEAGAQAALDRLGDALTTED